MEISNKKEVVKDKSFIAYCGLYCGSCRTFLKGKCPGCMDNTKATWCNIRKCCTENNFQSCSDCKTSNVNDCKKFNTFISKIIGFAFNSDRKACISRIKEIGYDDYAIEMAESRRQTIKRK
jgi:hypothetical protein